MQNLVPHFILKKHAAGQRQGCFSAASLFVDISGFSAVTHALLEHGSEAAEALAEVMCRVFEPLVDAVYAQGGWIATFAGDAFTVLFPEEEGQPHQRALAAAVAVQQHMIAHPMQETSYGRFPFTVKLGLGDGEVNWGILVPKQAEQPAAYYVSGAAVDASVRAEHHARPGNIILSPGVGASLGELVKTLPAGDEGYTRLLVVEGELPESQLLTMPELLPGQGTFVPQTVLDRSSQGEFRQVVSVFVNLMNIDSGEDLATFMDAVFDLRGQYGGYLARVDFGDKGCNLLLFWGVPRSTENDVERALGFVHDLGDYTPGTYKAGITYHSMYTGLAGSARRGEYTAYGGGVSYAARLMMAAAWGSIWLDERVANRARGRYLIELQGEQTFKGFDEPQPVYALVERRALDIAGFYQGEMVGREAELAQLEDFVQPLFAPPGEKRFAGILIVEGEAGLGKSRLVTEFLQRLATDRREGTGPVAQWFLCQTDQTVRQPFNPFRYWLRTYFGQSPTQSETRNKRAFGRQLDQLIAAAPPEAEDLRHALDRGRSFLGALLGLHWPNSPYTQLNPQGRHEWTVTALKSLILAESLRQPVIINLEDAQWLDAESVEFIERLVRQVDAYPLAILATARPEIGDKPLFGAAPCEKIDLSIMEDADLVQLAANLLEGAIGDDLAGLLAERAEGNPFFAEQILLYLREGGGIELVDGTWRLVGDRPASALPSDVRAIFTACLDRLTGEVKDVVQTAAVLGREFQVPVLAQMLRDDAALPDKVQSAEEEAIWSALSQVRYIFKHALLRDAAYEMQLRARRRELHQLAAEALERLYADDLTPHYGAIAHHYEAACRLGLDAVRDQAIATLRQAGERAAGNYENAAAVDYFSRALALIAADATPESEMAERRYDLLLGREAVYHLQGAREAQAGDLAALEALATARRRPTEQATVALRWARYANNTSDYPRAIEQAQAAITAAQAAGDVAQEAAGQLAWGGALRQQGEYAAAAEHSEQVLALAGAAGRRDLEVESLLILGSVAWRQGDYAGARGYWEQSLAMARDAGHGDQRSEDTSLNNLGILAAEQGDYAGARGYWEQSLAIFREIGGRRGEGIALGNLGEVARMQGDYAGARGYFDQALAIACEIGDRQGEGFVPYNLGLVVGSQGDYVGARGCFERSLAILREIGHRLGEGYALTGLGDALTGLGNPAEAVTFLQQAIALWRDLGHHALLMEALATLARAYLAQGDTTQALAAVGDILTHLNEGDNFDGTENPLRNYLTCYQVLQAAGDSRAAEVLQIAYNALQEQATRIPDEPTRRSFLENVPWHREILVAYRGEEVGEIEIETRDREEKVEAAPVETAQVKPAVGVHPPVAKAPPTEPEGEPVAGDAVALVEPPTTAAAMQVAEALAAAAETLGAAIIVTGPITGPINIHFHTSPDISVGQDATSKSQKKKGKKRQAGSVRKKQKATKKDGNQR